MKITFNKEIKNTIIIRRSAYWKSSDALEQYIANPHLLSGKKRAVTPRLIIN